MSCRAVEGACPSSTRGMRSHPMASQNRAWREPTFGIAGKMPALPKLAIPLILAGPAGSHRVVVLELNLRRMQERVVDKAMSHGILDAGAMLVIQL